MKSVKKNMQIEGYSNSWMFWH